MMSPHNTHHLSQPSDYAAYAHCRPIRRCRGPLLDNHFTSWPFGISLPISFHFWYSAFWNGVKPNLLDMCTFCRPANLNLARRKASHAISAFSSFVRTDINTCPIRTRAAVPYDFPKAPRIPVDKRSAPAHDNVLLIRRT